MLKGLQHLCKVLGGKFTCDKLGEMSGALIFQLPCDVEEDKDKENLEDRVETEFSVRDTAADKRTILTVTNNLLEKMAVRTVFENEFGIARKNLITIRNLDLLASTLSDFHE